MRCSTGIGCFQGSPRRTVMLCFYEVLPPLTSRSLIHPLQPKPSLLHSHFYISKFIKQDYNYTSRVISILKNLVSSRAIILVLFLFLFLFLPQCKAFGILVPRPGIEHITLALEAQSLNHRATREDLLFSF